MGTNGPAHEGDGAVTRHTDKAWSPGSKRQSHGPLLVSSATLWSTRQVERRGRLPTRSEDAGRNEYQK